MAPSDAQLYETPSGSSAGVMDAKSSFILSKKACSVVSSVARSKTQYLPGTAGLNEIMTTSEGGPTGMRRAEPDCSKSRFWVMAWCACVEAQRA